MVAVTGRVLFVKSAVTHAHAKKTPVRDRQNMFIVTRFCYIDMPFHIFYYDWCQGCCSLYQGLCYVEVPYVEVPLYVNNFFHTSIQLEFFII